MATYIPGITDYIPRIQPFKPDYNFYQKALESKQADYKAGYDKISNLYGSLLNADMMRETNIQKRDQFFNHVQNEIQRMSGVDLSLQENVGAAYKVFQPLIDDKNIAKDMVWTKKYQGQKNMAGYLKNCLEKDCKGRYWEDGVRALDYQAKEFATTDDKTALNFADPSYTPYANGMERAQKIAKEMGIEVQNVTHNGRYIVTTKNGEAVAGPLYNYFVSTLADDPEISAVNKTKAYLTRKDYVTQNASKYGGDEVAAERAYLMSATERIQQSLEDAQKETKTVVSSIEQKKKLMDNKIRKEGVNPDAQSDFLTDWSETRNQLAINNKAGETYNSAMEIIQSADPSDLDNMRARVDSALSTAYFQEDMANAAVAYATLHKSESWVADPFAKAAVDHEYRMKEMGQKFDYDVFLKKYEHELKNGLVVGPRTWEQEDPLLTPGDTGKEPIKTTITVERERWTKEAKNSALNYAQNAYDYYDTLRRSSDPDERKYGEEKLKYIFSPGGHMDNNFMLKDFGSNPAIDVEGGLGSWKSVYTRALESISGDKSLMKDPDGSIAVGFKKLQKTTADNLAVQNEANARDFHFNKNTANYVKHYGASEYRTDIDLLVDKDGREVSAGQFKLNYIAKHRMDDQYIARPQDLAEDADDVYKELANEFVETYNAKLAPGMKDASGSGFGGVGQRPMSTTYDASALSLNDRKDLHSFKKDLYKPGTFVMMGTNRAASDQVNYTKGLDNDPRLQALAGLWIDQTLKGGWKADTADGRNRPIAKVTYHGTALNQRGMEAITLTFDHDYLKSLKGKSNKSSTEKGASDALWNNETGTWNDKITIFMKDGELENNFSKRSKTSVVDAMLDYRGKYVIDQYTDGGGQIEINRDRGTLVASGSTQVLMENAKYESVPFPRIYSNSNNAEDFAENLNNYLAQLHQTNTLLRTDLINSMKKTTSVEELEQRKNTR